MIIYLELFLNFLKIGIVSFGGGYGMISIVRETALLNGWVTEEEFINLIAVSESTPGPIAVNMATFIGSIKAGVGGALVATLGVVLPSFIIIMIIAVLFKKFLQYKKVRAALYLIRPCIVGMIAATAFTMGLSLFFNIKNVESFFEINYQTLGIAFVLLCLSYLFKSFFKRNISPILLIIISAGLGILVNVII